MGIKKTLSIASSRNDRITWSEWLGSI